ncbi:uncharacterized protein EDB91DRAFT_1122053 [Suillus paluster]|uniref:uncharacterized protein n=1 Tax=Suillus paluster TaxID=48578 RepID=UPI001B878345|nr:uncharacterized protein EDB91DRAFT_1122053 [Suillus paluster]KAG1744996.1 hypothetical protein EDB91DRAFT_1122053 [Suillus paluster]
MEPETDYYQIGGFRAHSNEWFELYDDKPMIDAIANDQGRELRPGGRGAPVELVLGILPNGASYVLMTSHQMWAFVRKHGLRPPRKPWKVDNFLSLSPIYFATKNDLQEKLKTYKVKAQKKKQDKDKEDNSPANRGFIRGDYPDSPRAFFENQRVLYGLLTKSLTPGALGLITPSWASAIRVISIIVNTWHRDRRPERFDNPSIIDVGWTDVMLPDYFASRRVAETVHLKMKGALKNEKENASFEYGTTKEETTVDILYPDLRTLFTHDAAKCGVPLVVLVHEEEMVRGVLARSGIDVGSFTSVAALLQRGQPQKISRRMSSRSRSPRRLNTGASRSSRDYERRWKYEPDDHVEPFSVKQEDGQLTSVHIKQDDKNPTSSKQDGVIPLPAACIVNVQTMVRALMRTDQTGPSVQATAQRLNIPANPRLPCAGNESRLLLNMWISMAEGRPIDEQWMDRLANPLQPDSPILAPVEAGAEEDVDPNDYIPPSMTNSGATAAREEYWSDDDW